VIKIHHLNNSRSQRVLWLLEEINQPYEIIRYERDPKTIRAPESLRKIHPLGKSPVIEDGTRTMAETGAILEYLVETYAPQLAPQRGTDAFWRYTYWMHYAEGSLMPALLMKLVADRMGVLGWPIKGIVQRQVKLHLDYLEVELAKSEWFAGAQLTAADVMMSFPLEASVSRAGLTKKSNPKLLDFVARVHARPAYKRALEKGGEYAYAK
jgi:glutathione S-transferase